MADQRTATAGGASGGSGGSGGSGRAAIADQRASHAGEVQRLFDAKAATWPEKYAPGGPLAARLTSLADAVCQHVPSGGRVLDLGCGTGELARALARAGMRASGCDISARMLESAAAGDPGRRVSLVQLDPDWRRLPFGPATFDAVVAASVLEYVDEPAAVLAECARVLRPGGVLVCTVPDLRHPVRWLEELARTAARITPVRAAGHQWPRWARYEAYLRASRQRHRVRWWLSTAVAAGDLHPVPDAAGTPGHAPLRLLMFCRLSNKEDS